MSQLKSYLLTFTPCLIDETGLVDFFSSLFELKKFSVVKRKHKEVQDVVLVISSDKNSEMLEQPSFGFKESFCSVKKISIEESEDLILKNRTKLYVGAIPYGVDNVRIWNHFAHYGTLEYSFIIRKSERNGKKGFGFVIFKNRHSLEKALTCSHHIDGKKLICSEFSCKTKMQKNRTTSSQICNYDPKPELNQNYQVDKITKTPLRRNDQYFNLQEQESSEYFQNDYQRNYHNETSEDFPDDQNHFMNKGSQRYDNYSFNCNYLQNLDQRNWNYSSKYAQKQGEFIQSRAEISNGGLQNFHLRKSTMREAPIENYGACYSCF